MINEQKIDEIRQRSDLRSLAEEAGAVFHGESANCPLHAGGDNKTAFHLRDGGQRWHCFTRCPEDRNDGDVIGFYMAWKGVEFKQALTELAQRAGVDLNGNGTSPNGVSPNGASRPSRTTLPASAVYALTPEAPQPPSQPWQERAEAFVQYAHSRLAGYEPACRYLFNERGLDERAWLAFRLGYNPGDLYDAPERWGLDGKRIWLPRGIVIPGQSGGDHWYIKVRRPMPGDGLAEYIGAVKELPELKFSGPRGGVSAMFGTDLWIGFPALMLVEGEWDCMLSWSKAGDLCDFASLGSATNRVDMLDLANLSRYAGVIVVYDDDKAGEKARAYWGEVQKVMGARLSIVTPPDHDLTDYWLHGGALRRWIAGRVAEKMDGILANLDGKRFPEKRQEWEKINEHVKGELG